ncbi:MAG: amino acid permease [Actinomycetota bacterium]|nr:amino acid permease [Actinomycetota bacterium]
MKLKKDLKLIDVFCIATGAMISSGLFVLPGLAHAKAGPAAVISYFLAGLLALIGVLNIAELVTAMPKAGGDYFFITRGLGPAIGTVAGMLSWFSLSLKSAFALVGIAAFIRIIFEFNMQALAIALCLIFVAINFLGVRQASKTQVIMVAFLLAILVIYIGFSLPRISIARFGTFAPNGIMSVFSTTGFVFVSYGGLLKISSIAEEVKDPKRTLPLGLILSLAVTTVIYGVVVFITIGLVEPSQLDNSLTPISDGASVSMGMGGIILLSIAAILAFISTVNAGILSASRYPFALSRDGLFPAMFRKIHKRFHTPYIAIFATGLFIIIFLFLELDLLVKVASTIVILAYILSILSVIVLRSSNLQNYRPGFRAPFFPWIQIAGIMGFIFVIIEMGRNAIILSVALIVVGIIIYLAYGRKRVKGKEHALLYLFDGVTPKDRPLTSGSLEHELKNIIYERDNIKKDDFHQVVENSTVLDLKQCLTIDQLYMMISRTLAQRLDEDPQYFYQKFEKRELESSTQITDEIIMPNIIIDQKGFFELFLVRCKNGLSIENCNLNIIAAFFLVSSRDRRNLMLRTHTFLSQIIAEEDFELRWTQAKDDPSIKDVILLGKRKRS